MVEQGLLLQARQHGDPNRRLGMTSRLWGAVKVVAPVLLGLDVLAPSPLLAAERLVLVLGDLLAACKHTSNTARILLLVHKGQVEPMDLSRASETI